MTNIVYISLSEEDSILIYKMDDVSGRLSLIDKTKVEGGPAPLTKDPEGKLLFVGSRASCKVSSFSINQTSGSLTPLNSTKLNSDPCYMSTDRKGKVLLLSYYAAGGVSVHSIEPNGEIGHDHSYWLNTDTGAHCIQTTPSNKFAFVPHIAGAVGTNAIFQFRFDEKSGQLIPNTPYKVIPSDDVGPRHFCFHPNNEVVYFSNEQGSSVTAYTLSMSSGTLKPFQTVPTIPSDFLSDNTCAQIHISPRGNLLCVSNRGHNSIACFSVNRSTGSLNLTDIKPTVPTPRAFNFDATGKFLIATSVDTGRLVSYRIDEESGTLDTIEEFEVGNGPMWVLPLQL